jgi:hypothetical protein
MRKEFIGQGHEHTVFRINNNEEWVLKRPRVLQKILYSKIEIENEIKNNTIRIANENIVIPRTRLFPFNKSYIVAQKYIEEDNSVNIKEQFLEENNEYLLHRYESQPHNFIANQGIVYWIDPTKGSTPRFLEKFFGVEEMKYRKFKRRIRNYISR